MDRISWENVPGDLKRAIEQRTGPIVAALTAGAGQNSPLAATVATAEGKTFVKGVPSHDRRSAGQAREVAVAPLKMAEDRLRDYVHDPALLKIFGGSPLLHTDWMPHNVLISPSRPYLIDWAWPMLGAAWIDSAYWLVRLIASGHSVQDAEEYAAQVPGYADADPAHIDLFASANALVWDEIEQQAPKISPWMRRVVEASHEWCDFRK